ncbi:GNAT family N-acetyltransferase [Candidatus Gottesmanbacteria bacterium]|nr:GNAT family N-acetyltransferase [Candidatus Gottesmanbacteria bacterium]
MLRKAKKSDVSAIYLLIAWGAKNGKVLPRPEKEILGVINFFHVWEEEGKLVGCVSLDIYSKKMAEIRSLIVLPNYQGQGIGRALVSECLKKAKKAGIYEVLSITDKDGFFEKMGFSKCLQGQWPMFIKP